MLSYRTTGFNGYAVQYSPFFDNRLAVASSANFGLVGNGRLHVLRITDQGQIQPEMELDTQDGLFDLAWSETHENHVVTASGDGDIKLFDVAAGRAFPIMRFREHTKEVFSVNWNMVQRDIFCSASWDGTIKVWNPTRPDSMTTLHTPVAVGAAAAPPAPVPTPPMTANQKPMAPNNNPVCIHNAKFSPHSPNLIASAHADSHVRIWDIRAPAQGSLVQDFFAHAGTEVLGLDFNKYRQTVLATAGVDKAVKIWDLRHIPPSTANEVSYPSPSNELLGHNYAVRSVSWSPHASDILLSTSYDMTARVWRDVADDRARYLTRINHNSGLLQVMNKHTEFVIGSDWSLWGQQGWVATVGWDEMLHVWKAT